MLARFVLPTMIACLIGVCLGIQPIFNTVVAKPVGMWYAALCSLSVSISIVLCICFINDRFQTLKNFGDIPKFYILAGICGIIILAFTVFCIVRIGPVLTSSITVTVQMAVATIVAHYGWFGINQEPINFVKILGIAFLITGVILVKVSITGK